MPTVRRWKGYKFLFYSPTRANLRISTSGKAVAKRKFWLSNCQLAKSRGFAEHELRQMQRKVEEQREKLLRAWHEHFGA